MESVEFRFADHDIRAMIEAASKDPTLSHGAFVYLCSSVYKEVDNSRECKIEAIKWFASKVERR